jgi:dTDP-glucose 4,6-dehydratase
MRILVTGGAGFIGSALIRHLIADSDHEVLNFDKLTYAGCPASLRAVADHPRYRFVRADICATAAVAEAIARFRPMTIIHLAAESHVDRSIDAPAGFVETNIVGTFVLLQQALTFYRSLPQAERASFRFHHVSTDEVFGSLGQSGRFVEMSRYDPRSPYSASKAASDHLVRAWHHSYGLPVLVTNCSNNYGPCQFPEKLIPLVILRAIAGRDIPVYGDGGNVRDWLHVEDHARALRRVFEAGVTGETYNIGGDAEQRNIDVVRAVCAALDSLRPRADGCPHTEAIRFVTDRPGHDRRYAIDATKMRDELSWRPRVTFAQGIAATVRWYLDNRDWWTEASARGGYDTTRLGLADTGVDG